MIDMSSINAVMQRISDIEYQIGIKRPRVSGGASFQQMMEDEMKKQTPARETPPRAETPKAPALPTAASMAPRFFSGKTPVTKPSSPENPVNGSAATGIDPYAAAFPGGYETPDSAYLGTIREAAGKYNVDPKLVQAVAEVESGFNQDAVSSVGAVGVMQLMPETADALGVNPYDAAQNIEGGAKYLRQLLDAFHGDIRKAVAAYNAGPQAVRDYGGVPPYSETQTYVDSVLDLYR